MDVNAIQSRHGKDETGAVRDGATTVLAAILLREAVSSLLGRKDRSRDSLVLLNPCRLTPGLCLQLLPTQSSGIPLGRACLAGLGCGVKWEKWGACADKTFSDKAGCREKFPGRFFPATKPSQLSRSQRTERHQKPSNNVCDWNPRLLHQVRQHLAPVAGQQEGCPHLRLLRHREQRSGHVTRDRGVSGPMADEEKLQTWAQRRQLPRQSLPISLRS